MTGPNGMHGGKLLTLVAQSFGLGHANPQIPGLMNSKVTPLAFCCASAFVFLSANIGHAAIIAYDQFSGYSSGLIAGQGQGSGWSGSWSSGATNDSYITTGLTHPLGGVGQSGDAVEIGANTSADGTVNISRALASTISAVGTYYFSFLINITDNPNNAGLVLADADTDRLYVGSWNGQGGNTEWRLTKYDGSYVGQNTGINDTAGTTFHLVVRFELKSGSNDVADLFINPANAAALAGASDATVSFADFSQIGNITISRNNSSTADGSFIMDEVLIATQASDVFAPIPEPHVALLGGLGALLLLRRKRCAA